MKITSAQMLAHTLRNERKKRNQSQSKTADSVCKHPCNPNHSLLEIFRHTDYAPGGDRYA